MGGAIIPRIFDLMQPEDIRDKKVLISPLNWGMGHVSRCIGLIYQLISQENEIVIACSQDHQDVFQCYFPECTYVLHKGYPFQFGGKGHFGWDLATSMAALQTRLKKEKVETESYVRELQVDVVLSDHRYGFYTNEVTSIFITHQYHLPVRGLQLLANRWHKKRMRPFNHVWILDYPDCRLSGKLSAKPDDERVEFIGPYSRFMVYPEAKNKTEESVVVVSGPEIYAQQFADAMAQQFPDALFVSPETINLDAKIRRITGNWREQDQAILKAKQLISRSGYSTIMDLEILKVPAKLFPTPGQAEQLYLHDRLTGCSEYTP